jgi:hypothetical protein
MILYKPDAAVVTLGTTGSDIPEVKPFGPVQLHDCPSESGVVDSSNVVPEHTGGL